MRKMKQKKGKEPENKVKNENKVISEIKSKSDEYRQEKDFV